MIYNAYFTLGDGGLDYSVACALALVKGGVDILEVGLPYSDPVADGPVIQKAMERSLKAGTKVRDFLTFMRKFREKSDVPVVLFSYYNPILAAGPEFLKEAKEAGANGLLIADVPFDKYPETELDPILIVSTSTPDERVEQIAARAKCFIYYACQKGTTGMRSQLPAHFPHDIARIKKHSSLPIVAGFGISNRETATEAVRYADGFVVGSYFVDAMSRRISPEKLTQLAKELKP